LKVRGIYSTSDARWEGFEAKIEEEKTVEDLGKSSTVTIERFEK
jgi:hypothetical protein